MNKFVFELFIVVARMRKKGVIIMSKKKAARLGDGTSHGGKIVSGSPNVFINNKPAATAISAHVCPNATKTNPPIPHIGGPAIRPAKAAVFVNGVPAIRDGDKFFCNSSPPAKARGGSRNVIIG